MSSSVLFERTLALRQGFKPLSDYRFDAKLTPMCPHAYPDRNLGTGDRKPVFLGILNL
jgi:hypothetical protein